MEMLRRTSPSSGPWEGVHEVIRDSGSETGNLKETKGVLEPERPGREKVKLDTHPLLVVWKAKAPSAREVPPLSGCSFYRWNTIRTDRHLKWVEDNVARNGLEQGPWAVESAMNQTPVDKATWKGPPPRPSRTNSWAAEAAAAHRAAPSPGSLCSLPGVLSTANFPDTSSLPQEKQPSLILPPAPPHKEKQQPPLTSSPPPPPSKRSKNRKQIKDCTIDEPGENTALLG
ncbi:uncharacterized protein [Vicugna pacos]|uniref:Uncharacterized protein isoform X2 n=1 Tax=Vicugna pacos TaxID=30538 RepID=A0ABM5BC19_VICPA